MSKRYNITVITAYEANGEKRKSYDVCGSAFENQTENNGTVINLKFKYIPVPAPGQTMEIALFEPKAKDAE